MTMTTPFTTQVGIDVPIICGAMYPCSNPELVAAASEAGAIAIIQPMSLVFAHGMNFRQGVQKIKQLTNKPVGFNAIIEKSVKAFEKQMEGWIDTALEEGVRFFITALGNPKWVVRKVEQVGGVVYHDVTERKWAQKALDAGVHGLVCVNNRAGGHAGPHAPQRLFDDMSDLGVPLVCAGGVGDPGTFKEMLDLGYAGVQAGTRFIASRECTAHQDYKEAIIKASADDIAMTDRISGVPCAIIVTPTVKKMGLKAGPIAKRLLRNEHTKRWMRTAYSLQSMWRMKKVNALGSGFKDYYQAGKSVQGVHSVETVQDIVQQYACVLDKPTQAKD